MFDFSKLTRRQRIILRNRTERLSELLDWNTLGIVRNFLFLFVNEFDWRMICILVLLSCSTNGFNKSPSRIRRRNASICRQLNIILYWWFQILFLFSQVEHHQMYQHLVYLVRQHQHHLIMMMKEAMKKKIMQHPQKFQWRA